MKIIFTGDLFLGGDLNKQIGKNFIRSPSFWKADKVVVNLESPLSDNLEKADKGVLFAHPDSAKNLKLWNVSAVNLANNHIQDKGIDGIYDTFNTLNKYSIPYFGAGKNINEARQPYFLDENLCVIGFCQSKAPTLNFIQEAEENIPGVNILTYKHIDEILTELPSNAKAILHFHWGQEHLWLTQPDIIKLAKKCLKNPKVEMIIGMHPHRIQGKIVEGGKSAYLCLGNFLFPNFYIDKPAELSYPEIIPKKIDVTYQYHKVNKLTYKKWKFKNRLSYLVEYDTLKRSSKIIPVLQDINEPVIKELEGVRARLVLLLFNCLTLMHRLPNSIYFPLHKLNSILSRRKWALFNRIFWIKQNGFKKKSSKIIQKF